MFYTANNIAYSALTALIPKNSAEQVEMGSYRFMFAFATSLLIQSITLGAVTALGGGAAGWRTVAIIYAIIGLIVNTLSVFSVKELPESELVDTNDKKEIEQDEKYNLVQAAKLLAASNFDSALAVQPESCISMLKIMYLVIPFALDAVITFILSRMKVEEANAKLRAAA